MDYSKLMRPVTGQDSKNAEPTKTVVSMDTLDTLEVAGKVTKELAFPVTCGIRNGVPIFFAQLKGGKRFSATPVMPKDANGNVMAPLNGDEGYLTVELSENAQLELSGDGRYEFTVRPVFKDWESVADHAARLKAQSAKKTA